MKEKGKGGRFLPLLLLLGPFFGLWALFWLVMGSGAANNARLGLNSIHVPPRFRREKKNEDPTDSGGSSLS